MSVRFLLGLTAIFALLVTPSLAGFKKELAQQEALLEELSAKERRILQDLERLAAEIEGKRREIEGLEEEIAKKKLLIRELERQLKAKTEELRSLSTLFQKRLKALATTGRLGWLNLLLAPAEVSSFLRREEYAFLILEHDRLLAAKLRKEKEEFERQKKRLVQEEERLRHLREELALELNSLKRLKQEKEALLSEVRSNRRLYAETLKTLKAAYLAIEQMAKELETTRQELARAKEEVEEIKKKKSSRPRLPPLLEVKGYLLPPVEGEVVRFFGLEEDPVTGEKIFQPGITIAAHPGTPVKAPYGGEVVRISNVRGKGFVVFIDHGYHFLSVIGGLGKLRVTPGQEVRTGEIIGEVGALPFGPEGVYYELRYKDHPQNPLDWLETSKLRFLR